MPRHRNDHWTDGDGIGKKLKGGELHEHLKELAITVEVYHTKAKANWRGWLDHARRAGDALLEAKRRLGHRTKWSKWRNRNFIESNIMSKSTSVNYMKIARNWNDARLVEARQNGIKLDSIRAVLRVLSGTAPPKPDPRDKRPGETIFEFIDRQDKYEATSEGRERRRKEEIQQTRKQICREFAAKIRGLDEEELRVLSETFDPYTGDTWEKLYADLRNMVCVIYGPNDEDAWETEKLDRAVIEKIKQALNRPGRKNRRRRHATTGTRSRLSAKPLPPDGEDG